MALVFEVCFFCGVGLTVALLLLGGLLNAFDVNGIDFDIDFCGLSMALPNPVIWLIFLTVFGGTGIIMNCIDIELWWGIQCLIAAILGGGIAWVVEHFVIRPLKAAQNTSIPENEELIGLPAIVTETIVQGGFGQITYYVNGNTYVAPAKEMNGKDLEKGTEVAICWVKEFIFYVVKLDEEGE